MLFPKEDDVTRVWRTVCDAVIDDTLGTTAKVATADPTSTKEERLICVYTQDFSNLEDVRRVLDEMVDLGLAPREGRGIYYKCDAYTYLGIESDNPFKLRASLYSSKDLLSMSKPAKGPSSTATKEKKNGKLNGWLF